MATAARAALPPQAGPHPTSVRAGTTAPHSHARTVSVLSVLTCHTLRSCMLTQTLCT